MNDPRIHSHRIIVGKQSKSHNFGIQRAPFELLAHLRNDVMQHTGNPINGLDTTLSHFWGHETFEGS